MHQLEFLAEKLRLNARRRCDPPMGRRAGAVPVIRIEERRSLQTEIRAADAGDSQYESWFYEHPGLIDMGNKLECRFYVVANEVPVTAYVVGAHLRERFGARVDARLVGHFDADLDLKNQLRRDWDARNRH